MRHAPRTPRPQPAPPARKAPSAPPANTYTPPAGFPADPVEWLAYLKAGQFTDAQLRYLHGPAFVQYVGAINAARGSDALAGIVALGDQIIAAWATIRATTAPPAAGNPFGA
jgi:hypothetical protein